MIYLSLNLYIFVLVSFIFFLFNRKIDYVYPWTYKAFYLGIFISIVWIVILSFLITVSYDQVVIFLETYIAPDGKISNPDLQLIILVTTPIFLLAKVVFFLQTSQSFEIKKNLSVIYFIFFGVQLLGYLLFNQYSFSGFILSEDNFLEWATFIFSIVASILFLIRGILGSKFAYICFIAFFFFSMEEISWGQRVFLIQSPEFFLENNFQQELNIHNFFNPFLGLIYFSFNIVILSFLTWFRRIQLFSRFYNVEGVDDFIKVSDKFGLWLVPAFLMFMNFNPGGEFIEIEWALFGFIYSILMLHDYISKNDLNEGGIK